MDPRKNGGRQEMITKCEKENQAMFVNLIYLFFNFSTHFLLTVLFSLDLFGFTTFQYFSQIRRTVVFDQVT